MPELVAVLQDACEHPVGKALEFGTEADAKHFRQRLYGAAKTDPDFAELSFLLRGKEVWIVNLTQ